VVVARAGNSSKGTERQPCVLRTITARLARTDRPAHKPPVRPAFTGIKRTRSHAGNDRHYLALQQTAAAESWLRSDARRRLFAGPGQDAWPQAAPVTGSLTPLETTC